MELPKDLAEIIIHKHTPGRGNSYFTFEWSGRAEWPVLIRLDINIKDLPWRLKKIGEYPPADAGIYIRQDPAFAWWSFLKVRMSDLWMWFFARFILTLEIWGLARTRMGANPSWSDIGRKNK